MSKPLIIANWKCNPSSLAQAKALFAKVSQGAKKYKRKAKVIVCPPLAFLPFLKQKKQDIVLGSQNVFWKEGASTGEVSAKMLKSIGCEYVIVGHSERRQAGESNEDINKKIKSVLQEGLIPIFCIGETLVQKNAQATVGILQSQIKEGLTGIAKNKAGKIIIAYEPVWAIGTGISCQADEAMSMAILIRRSLSQKYGRSAVRQIKILYGGSATSNNAEEYIGEAGMDGLLVGGASLSAKEFIAILRVL
jgi:triosephosphate isomerase (TIM)